MEKKYVWLNINDGRFSNSWSESDHKILATSDIIEASKARGWKLIEYTCLTDTEFSFYDMMKIVTNTHKPPQP